MSIETRTIGLNQAIGEIASACGQDSRKNFVFIVGAGISNPPVPLAGEITAHCRDKARQYNPDVCEPSAGKAGGDYSHWFDRAYPQPQQKRQYLESLIKGRPLSPASLRLAHVLMTKQVADTVITPNFDDFISRALTLFGETNFSLCDHPRITDRIDSEEHDIKVVHVHGSYRIYDLANSEDELADRASSSSSTTLTMSSLLDRLFAYRGALVIGYSGWDGDVIMEALKRRLVGQRLPYRLYFFCYRRSNRDELPDWIRNHQDVRFVVPPEEKLKAPESKVVVGANRSEPDRVGPGAKLVADPLTGDRGGEPTLQAKDILDALIQRLKLDPPKLVTDPLVFFEQQLRDAALPESEQDPYSFLSVADRIHAASVLLSAQGAEQQGVATSLESVRNAIRRSQYSEAVEIASTVELSVLRAKERDDLFRTLMLVWSATRAPEDNLRVIEQLEKVHAELDQSAKERFGTDFARVLGDKGIALGQLNRGEEALAVYDDLLRRFGDATESALREQVARALFNKGVTLGQLNRGEEALAVYDDLLRRFGDATEPALREGVAKALFNKGFTLGQLSRNEDAVAVYDDVARRFGDATEPALREQVAKALFNKGVTLGQLNRSEEELGVYDDLLRRFGDATEPALRERAAKALVNKGVTLGQLYRGEEALAVYDDMLRRFGDAAEPALREQVARALVNKGVALGQLSRGEEALAVYDDLLRRFGDTTEPALREGVARALVNKGITLGQLNRTDDELAVYDDVVRRFEDATEPALREQVATALINKGMALEEMKQIGTALNAYEEVVRRFAGDSTGEIADPLTMARKKIEDLRSGGNHQAPTQD
jgi:tetratricopeptide (TPR) repeat protein